MPMMRREFSFTFYRETKWSQIFTQSEKKVMDRQRTKAIISILGMLRRRGVEYYALQRIGDKQ